MKGKFKGEDVMRKLQAGARSELLPLCAGTHETFVMSCLEGHMGSAYVSDCGMRSVYLSVGDFGLLFGAADAAFLLEVKEYIGGAQRLLASDVPEIMALIPRVFWGSCQEIERYAFERCAAFDLDRLVAYERAIPSEYTLCDMDEHLYQAALEMPWSRDFVSQFDSAQDYVTRGLGVAALCRGELVAGASSYIVWSGGMEIQVDTRADARRRGLALACSARLIARCVQKGKYPDWDAANVASLRLAGKLGYSLKGAYPAFEINP